MEDRHCVVLLIFISSVFMLGLFISFSTTTSHPPPPSASPPLPSTLHLSLLLQPPSSSSSPQPNRHRQRQKPIVEIQEAQLKRIIEALVGSGDFIDWAGILSSTDPSTIPISATLFIPHDGGNVSIRIDPLLLPYHVVPQRLSFSDLRLFPVDSRLPTLLQGKTLLVTHNSASNFTIDGTPITHPDLFLSGLVSAHGVGGVLDYTMYGNQTRSSGGSYGSTPVANVFPPPITPGSGGGGGRVMERSDAACYCAEFPIAVAFVAAACSVFGPQDAEIVNFSLMTVVATCKLSGESSFIGRWMSLLSP